ncbi:hypothetical protein RFI_34812 [Reticulomyxa filosa]|uniref:Uncharacterized protein n=1 Tax=Reticulomyxa filosa TaxID=46433 RepID=X6LMJ9_RETFI|nr:hypothetical protein RFI_34812 [Reticulomyxa filosa]|eukprot:ETO02606.1 hypothetical protein RFI_34812 [Reticulomyxa filosa]
MYMINNEYKYKSEYARHLYAQAIQKCLLFNDVFNHLMNGPKYDSSNNAQYLYAKSFGRISSQLNEAWKGLNNKLDDKKENILKCKEKQFDNIIACWIDELKGKDKDTCRTCVESVVNLLKSLTNGKQLDNHFHCLINGLNVENWYYTEILRKIALQVNNIKILNIIHQLDNVLEFLKSISHPDFCIGLLRMISMKLNKRQINDITQIHTKWIEILFKVNERQLNNIFHDK